MYIPQPDRILLKEQIKKYARHIHGRVLDVGAGGFSRYQNFFDYSQYVKMDVFEDKNIDVVGSADDIPFVDESFDSIISTQVLEDVKDIFKSAREFYRVLKPGGTALITTTFLVSVCDEPDNFWRFTGYGLEYLYKNTGFEIVAKERRGGFFSVRAQSNLRYLIERLNLYSHRWTKVFNPVFKAYGLIAIWLDKIDRSPVNQKFSLGWGIVIRKPELK